MKKLFAIVALTLLTTNKSLAGANCKHSHSWQCSSSTAVSSQNSQTDTGIGSGGHTPDPGTTNEHLGTGGGTGDSQPAVALVPAMKVPPLPENKTPPEPQIAVPEKIEQKIPEPMKVPPLPENKTPPEPQIAVPEKIEQKIPEPMKVPPLPENKTPPEPQIAVPEKIEQKIPEPLWVAPNPSQVHGSGNTSEVVGSNSNSPNYGQKLKPVMTDHKPGPVGNKAPTVVAVSNKQTPTITGSKTPTRPTHIVQPVGGLTSFPRGGSGALWLEEVIEPGIQNRRVELYRSNDAKEVLYRDVIPMDKTGFHLTVFGVRAPSYD